MTGPHQTPPVDADVGLLDVEEGVGETIVLAGEGVDSGEYADGTFTKIGWAMFTLFVLIVCAYLIPGADRIRPWTSDDPVVFWNIIGRELMGEGEEAAEKEESLEEAEAIAKAVAEEETKVIEDKPVIAPPEDDDKLPAYKPHPDDELDVDRELDMPQPDVLDTFFERLAKTDAGYEGAITRVVHWGDSVIANDNVTSTLRLKMQRRFGDAGHGFHLIAKPNTSYRHKGVRFRGGESWSRCYIINKCRSDGHYGLGGTTVWSAGGAKSSFGTARDGAIGRKVSRYELWYAAAPKGGKIRLKLDKNEEVLIETAAEQLEDRWHTFETTDDAHQLEVRAQGGGRVRLYGMVMERDVPGVVWDGMAQLGAFTSRMLYFDSDHIKAQIEHRDPGLIVFQFGGNDLQIRKSAIPKLEEQFTEVIRRFRAGKNPPACLVVSPVDHGYRDSGRIKSDPMVRPISDAQKKVALAEGCAFFDTLEAMGGDGSVARWRRRKPSLISGDLAHLTSDGQRVLGQLIYLALMKAYRDYRAREG